MVKLVVDILKADFNGKNEIIEFLNEDSGIEIFGVVLAQVNFF